MKAILALVLSLSAVLIHVNHDDNNSNKSAQGDFHFGPVTDGNENSQPNKEDI